MCRFALGALCQLYHVELPSSEVWSSGVEDNSLGRAVHGQEIVWEQCLHGWASGQMSYHHGSETADTWSICSSRTHVNAIVAQQVTLQHVARQWHCLLPHCLSHPM